MNMKLQTGYDCLSVCVTNSCRRYGGDFFDEELYFSSGVGEICFDKSRKVLFSNLHGLLKEKIKKAGVKQLCEKNIEQGKPCRYLRRFIRNGNIIVLCVQTGALTYRNIYFQNYSIGHYICLSNYSEESNKFYVLDGFIPNDDTSVFEGWVGADEILRAWKETGYVHYIFSDNKTIVDVSKNYVNLNFEKTVEHYLDSYTLNDIVTGEKAITEFIKQLTLENNFENVVNQLKIFGFITCKRYILVMLKKSNNLQEMVDDYENIVNSWDTFCLKLFKMYITNRYGELDSTLLFAEEIIRKEHDVLIKITKCF